MLLLTFTCVFLLAANLALTNGEVEACYESDLRAMKVRLREFITHTHDSFGELISEISTLRHHNQEQEKIIKDLKQSDDDLLNSVQNLMLNYRDENAELHQKNAELAKAIKKEQGEINDLRYDMLDLEDTIDDKMQDMRNDSTYMSQSLLGLENKVVDMTVNYGHETKDIQSQTFKLANSIEKQQEEITGLRYDVTKLEDDIESLKDAHSEFEFNISISKEENENCQKEVDIVKQSHVEQAELIQDMKRNIKNELNDLQTNTARIEVQVRDNIDIVADLKQMGSYLENTIMSNLTQVVQFQNHDQCSLPPWKICSSDMYVCPSTDRSGKDPKLISRRLLCDNNADCPEGEDEDREPGGECYSTNCADGYFWCRNGQKCIPEEKLCDNFQNCDDGSDEDESNCKTCSQDEFWCQADSKCLPAMRMCDGYSHCSDGSDEDRNNCFAYLDPWTQSKAVAFISKDLSNHNTTSGEVLIFINEELDISNDYNSTTGKFTAPVTGTYLFSVQLCTKPGTYSVYTLKSSKHTTTFHTGQLTDSSCSTGTSIATLSRNEEIWIEGETTTAFASQMVDQPWNMFAGTLITQYGY